MEANEIVDNVHKYGDRHLASDDRKAVNIVRDGKKQRLEEKLRAIDGQDCTIEPANASCSMDVSLKGDMPPEQGIQQTKPASAVDKGKQKVIYVEKNVPASRRKAKTEEFRQFNEQTEPGCSFRPTRESSSVDIPLPSKQDKQSEPVTVAQEIEKNSVYDGDFFLQLQEASNICKAAYKEIMRKALEANTFVESSPALGSLEEFEEIFSCHPPSGIRVECSIETAIVPVPPHILASMMMAAGRWALPVPDMVYRLSFHDPTGVFKQLEATDENILEAKMVNVELQLPSPLVETRRFCFLRFQRHIMKDIWAIVDISTDYFLHEQDRSKSERMCRRRPSGVIVRGHDGKSEVIWVENVEVYECQLENNIFSTVLNSNMAFCAKRWVSNLSKKIHRYHSVYYRCTMPVNQEARTYLLQLCNNMKRIFLECVHEYPDDKILTILSDQEGIRILKDERLDLTTFDLYSYVGLTSFRVKAKPISVYEYLVRRNIKLEWPSLQSQEKPEQLIALASIKAYNCINLYRRLVLEDDFEKFFECKLQEISKDDFCSYVISAPVSPQDAYNSLCCGERRNIPIQPSGYAIMADGSGGLQADASLVTIVVHMELEFAEADSAIDIMTNVVTTTMGDIEHAVAEGAAAMELPEIADLRN